MMSDRQQLIERAREAIDRWVRGGVEGMADGARLFLALGDLLAAVEAGDARTPVPPEVLQRARELSGNDDSLRLRMPWMNMAMERGDVIRALLPHLRPEAAASTPDFEAMSADERKAWLDERGRRGVWQQCGGAWHAALNERNQLGRIAEVIGNADEDAALLALCERVAAKERGEDE
jgi:hypothetical protein